MRLRLLDPLRADQPDVRATGVARIPDAATTFGVISDLDDTVIQSRIANFLQAMRTVMLGNARTRLPFPGVAAFYQALERGGDGARQNPIFYVSSSPWNIYDVIAEFMELQRIPDGPICLRDWDIDLSALARGRHRAHKEPLIREILDAYPAAAVHSDRGQQPARPRDLSCDHRQLPQADPGDLYQERGSQPRASSIHPTPGR